MGRGPGKKTPLTDLERQKGYNIRQKDKTNKSTRELKSTEIWSARNTHGSTKKRK